MIFPTNAKELDKTFAAMQAQGKSKAQMQAVYDEYKKRSAASSQSWLGRTTQNISETGQNLSESTQQKLAGVQEQMGSGTGLGAPPSNPFNPFPVESSKPDLLDKIGQYGGPVGRMASDMAKTTLGHAEEGLQTIGQGFKAIGQATKTDQLPSNPLTQGQGMSNENLAQVVGGVADVISGGLSTAFSPLSAVIEKTPVVNTLFEKIGQGQDALSAFLADKIGTTDEEKAALHKSFNNLMNLGVIKYGPKITEKAAPYVSDAATSLKGAISDITGDIKSSPLGKTASGFTNWTSEKLSNMSGKVRGSTESVINSNLDGLTKIENKLKSVSNFINDAKTKGIDVKQIVAETDLLKNAVDSDGNIKTLQPGGAVEQLKSKFKEADGVVMKALEAEGKTIPLSEVGDYMKSLIDQNSGLFGKAVDTAKANIDAEIAGLAKYTDANGNIKLSDLQKFKIAKAKTINYNNPESAIVEKDLVRGAKELIEQNTDSIDVKAINKELQRFYTIQEFLELLDGKKVQGARLGKYFAQTAGTIVGGLGLGPIGAIGGGELAKFIYGKSMQGTFKGSTGGELGLSEQMKSAIDQSSKNEGNLNTNQSTTSMNTTTPIQDTVPPPSGKSNFNTAGTAESAYLPKTKDVVKLGESKTNMPLIEEAKKYKSAEEFVKAQGEPVYHGSTADLTEGIVPSKTTGTRGENQLPGIYVADNYNFARSFSMKNGVQVSEPVAGIITGKILTAKNLPALKKLYGIKDLDKLAEMLKLEGHDAVKFTQDIGGAQETVVLNPDSFKTKSQLTDIWNKAHGK